MNHFCAVSSRALSPSNVKVEGSGILRCTHDAHHHKLGVRTYVRISDMRRTQEKKEPAQLSTQPAMLFTM